MGFTLSEHPPGAVGVDDQLIVCAALVLPATESRVTVYWTEPALVSLTTQLLFEEPVQEAAPPPVQVIAPVPGQLAVSVTLVFGAAEVAPEIVQTLAVALQVSVFVCASHASVPFGQLNVAVAAIPGPAKAKPIATKCRAAECRKYVFHRMLLENSPGVRRNFQAMLRCLKPDYRHDDGIMPEIPADPVRWPDERSVCPRTPLPS
ncbi:MAG: hypothetical protein U1F51_01885 [Burkholderiales bacterium]